MKKNNKSNNLVAVFLVIAAIVLLAGVAANFYLLTPTYQEPSATGKINVYVPDVGEPTTISGEVLVYVVNEEGG